MKSVEKLKVDTVGGDLDETLIKMLKEKRGQNKVSRKSRDTKVIAGRSVTSAHLKSIRGDIKSTTEPAPGPRETGRTHGGGRTHASA